MTDTYLKVVLLGESGVGKTSIIMRFLKGFFKDNSNSTIGVNSLDKIIKKGNKKYTLNIFDTAGQEKYRSITKNFYRDAYIILLVYDITSQITFDNLKEQWYPDVKLYAENCIILGIVGNKIDLFENDGAVDEDEAKKFAHEIGAIFYLVSAKGGDNILNLFDGFLNKFLEDDVQEKYQKIQKNKTFDSSYQLEKHKLKKKKKMDKTCCK